MNVFSVLKEKDARQRASKDFASFLKELARAGEIRLVNANQGGVKYWWAPTKGTASKGATAPEEIEEFLGGDGVKVVFTWHGESYEVYFAHGDFVEPDRFGVFGEYFEQFIREMKEMREYYYPDSTVPWHRLISSSAALVRGEDKRLFLYKEGILIPVEKREGFLLADDGTICCESRRLDHLTGRPVLRLISPESEEVKFFKNYLLLGKGRIIPKDDPYHERVVENPEDVVDGDPVWMDSSYIRNDEGKEFFFPLVSGLSPDEKLAFYEKHGFLKEAERLSKALGAERRRQEQRKEEEKQKRLREVARLEGFILSKDTLLMEVVFQQKDGGRIPDYEPSVVVSSTDIGRYTEDNPVCQYLYSIQEKGWRGRAERGMLINIPVAKRSLQKGILHLEVPKSAMGKIIGRGGVNISRTKEALRKKGLSDLRGIELHPVE